MSKKIINRYIWLIETIEKAGDSGISFRNINKSWLRTSASRGKDYPLRTFHNHRKEIRELFNVNILCNWSNDTYCIKSRGRSKISIVSPNSKIQTPISEKEALGEIVIKILNNNADLSIISEDQEIINQTEVKLRAAITDELTSKILSYGDYIEVVGPNELRNKVVERLKAAVKIYKKSEDKVTDTISKSKPSDSAPDNIIKLW